MLISPIARSTCRKLVDPAYLHRLKNHAGKHCVALQGLMPQSDRPVISRVLAWLCPMSVSNPMRLSWHIDAGIQGDQSEHTSYNSNWCVAVSQHRHASTVMLRQCVCCGMQARWASHYHSLPNDSAAHQRLHAVPLRVFCPGGTVNILAWCMALCGPEVLNSSI